MKVIGYTRVSTQEQADVGISLEAQEAKIRAWSELNGYGSVEMFADPGISGKAIDNREGLREALCRVGAGDALVVYSLSRLSRSTKDTLEVAERLAKKGADLVSISEKIDTTTAAGKMVFRMLAVLNEFERDVISERTRMAMIHKRAKGELVRAIPYGCRLTEDGRTLEADPRERNVILAARALRNAGMSFRAIASSLKVM